MFVTWLCKARCTWSLTLFTNSAALSQVSPDPSWIVSPYLQNAYSCREEVPHTMRVNFFAMCPKKFPQISPIDRALQLHFSTLEKTMIDHNPLLNFLVVAVFQVSPIYRHLEHIFQDLDISTRSSPGLMRRSNSSKVVIWLWHVLLLILIELVLPSQWCKLWK